MALRQSLPPSAELYAAEQRQEIQAAISAVLRLWRRMGEDFDSSFAQIAPTMLRVTDLAQSRVAAAAQEYVPAVLADTGQRAVARYDVDAQSLVGLNGDGRPVEGLLDESVIHAKVRIGSGSTVSEALSSSSRWLSTAVGTLLSDTGRASEHLGMQAHHVTGYVRMLEPPSCGRCVILAGKHTSSSTAFQRHPKCDCRNIPADESVAGDLTVDPRSYFDSLDEAGQQRLMGSQANAAAVRDQDANIGRIINAYRTKGSVSPAQVFGQDIKYTTVGTTRRAGFGRTVQGAQKAPRLMPETISTLAKGDPAETRRLLGLYGWLG